MADRDINATRKRFLLCSRRRSRSTPEVAAAPSIILDKGNLTYLKKLDGSQHPGSISLTLLFEHLALIEHREFKDHPIEVVHTDLTDCIRHNLTLRDQNIHLSQLRDDLFRLVSLPWRCYPP
jgi:hypothetical protein